MSAFGGVPISQSEMEAIDALLSSCPLGHAHGKIVMPRQMDESDLVVWVDRLFVVKEMIAGWRNR